MTLSPVATAELRNCRRAVKEAQSGHNPTAVPAPTTGSEPWVREPNDDDEGPGDPWETT